MVCGFDAVISFYPPELGSQGIMLVPAILFHFFQLISGSLISVKWTPKKEQMELPITEIKKIPENGDVLKNSPTAPVCHVCLG